MSTNVAFTNSASGRVSITVSAAGKSFTFTVNAVQPTTFSSLTKTGGDNQTTTLNTAFPTALSVQLSVTSGSAANQTIQFSATGPVTVPSTAVTDGNGRAQVTVQAGSTAGNATVTASIGSLTPVTFTLTVAPPGPQLTANSFYNGADFQKGAISPCSIATIIAPGLAPNISGVVASYNLVGFLNYTVAADSVTVAGAQAPIYNVSNQNGTQQVTFQVPCSVAPGANVPVVVTVGGFAAPAVNVTILPASPGVFQTQSNVTVPNFGSLPIAVIMKRDGTLVSPQNPARLNETVIAYVTGMGPTSPSVNTNALPIFGTAAPFTGQVVVGIQNAGVPVTFAQLSEDLIGVGLVAFQIPANSPTGNVVFSIGLVPVGSSTAYYSSPAAIYIQ